MFLFNVNNESILHEIQAPPIVEFRSPDQLVQRLQPHKGINITMLQGHRKSQLQSPSNS